MLKLKICSISFICFISSVMAAVDVEWESTGALSSGESAIRSDGTQLYAYNLGNSNEYTVNGVTFAGTASGPVADLADEGNVLWSPADNGKNANFSNLSGDFGALMDSGAWGLRNTKTTVTLNNLTEGRVYLVQVFSSDTRNGKSNTLVLDAGAANEFSSVDNGAANSGAQVTGTFTADATGQASFTFRYLSSAGNANMNAIQLRLLPEPPKGTVFMVSSISGWLLISSLFIFRREIKSVRNSVNK